MKGYNIASRDSRGLLLCVNCWNGKHKQFVKGKKREISLCGRGACECPCTDLKPPAQVKFDPKSTPDFHVGTITIGVKS